jgi:hypothetical protein
MVIITANEAVQAALAGVAERAEIRDSAGKLIGYFQPLGETRPTPEEIEKLVGNEELWKETKGPFYSTEEVIKQLDTLGNH